MRGGGVCGAQNTIQVTLGEFAQSETNMFTYSPGISQNRGCLLRNPSATR